MTVQKKLLMLHVFIHTLCVQLLDVKGFCISSFEKGILLTNKDCVIKTGDRLPALLNCPGTPCVWLDHKQ